MVNLKVLNADMHKIRPAKRGPQKLLMYPAKPNTLLNFVAFGPKRITILVLGYALRTLLARQRTQTVPKWLSETVAKIGSSQTSN